MSQQSNLKLATRSMSQPPTEHEVWTLPLARAGVYELSDKEVKTLRGRIYSLNKNNAANRRWRTLRDGPYLLVWRIS
jgi:hypothetical protein